MAGKFRRFSKSKIGKACIGFTMLFAICITSSQSFANENSAAESRRIAELEKLVKQLSSEVKTLRKTQVDTQKQQQEFRENMKEIMEDAAKVNESLLDFGKRLKKFSFGGYGEMHANFAQGKGADNFDIHRLVLYAGYEFNDWIKLHSETEIEHAFVTDGAGGQVVIEQLYLDFLLDPKINIRAGRILTPLGIINQKHEPPTFNGVERPLFEKYIIPTTWSSDGVGIFGQLTPWLSYQLYAVGGLDGSKFDAKNGIRKGRIKERPGLHDIAITGRLDFYPLANREVAYDQDLRVGVSMYYGGIENTNKGGTNDIGGNIQIYSADFEYSVSKLDFRGAIAYQRISSAAEIGNGTAEGLFGFYIEAGYHFMPDHWKRGKLKDSDAVFFARYDYVDTQYEMPTGVERDKSAQRNEWTIGINFYPTKNVVIKADYQIRNDESGNGLDNLINFGVGWSF